MRPIIYIPFWQKNAQFQAKLISLIVQNISEALFKITSMLLYLCYLFVNFLYFANLGMSKTISKFYKPILEIQLIFDNRARNWK